jgi:HlyD family secretion protein
MKKWIVIAVIVAAVLGGAGAWFGTRPRAAAKSAGQAYDLTTVKRGTIESTVASSGTLAPVSSVSVLAQMSGRVEKVHADYNDLVRKGAVLATLNTDMLLLEEQEARSAVTKARAQYNLQALDAQNKQKLSEKGLVSDYDLASSKASLEVMAADLAAAESALKRIQTELTQYAVITSPIDGIVLDRSVEEGQSVVEGSSANASSLFTLAGDLSRMEIRAEVDELDIGSIKVGQDVRFTVEAWPSLGFTGKVHQVRLVPTTEDNVVSYDVMIRAGNPDGSLLPGMTASVQFIREKREDVLVVPTAALRFQPTTMSAAAIQKMVFLAGLEGLSAEQKEQAERRYDEQVKGAAAGSAGGTGTRTGGLAGMMMPQGPPGMRRATGGSTAGQGNGTAAGGQATQAVKPLWYLDSQGKPAVLLVTVGASDATSTEVSGPPDLEGRSVILKVKVK